MPRRPRVSNGRLWEFVETIEIGAQEMATRWNDDIPPEARAEIMIKFYEPALRLLIEDGRRPRPK